MIRLWMMTALIMIGCQSKDGVGDQCQAIQKIESDILKDKREAVIYSYTYNNTTVYWVDDCKNCADAITTVYDCNGAVVCSFGGIAGLNTCPDFDTKATDKKLVWKTDY